MLKEIHSLLRKAAAPQSKSANFFKTKPGQYAAHDKFMGVSVPTIRLIAKDFYELPLVEITRLLQSPYNEERLFALILLVKQYEKDEKTIYDFYMKNKQYVNNWNLVDSSAHLIVGAYLFDKDPTVLFELAASPNLWERRISIVATWYFIRQDELELTFQIAKLLLNDSEDLIHKATGWMLREAGKRDEKQLRLFLDEYAKFMPRTMLRYAIEKFDEPLRQGYLRGWAN